MIDILKKYFGGCTEKDGAVSETDPAHDIRVATCALFLEMAHIDGEFSEAESEQIIATLKGEFGLSDAYVDALIEASRQELEGSIDLWQFTNRINQNYTKEEKMQIIETAWRIAYTDGSLDKHEDYLAHKLAKLLRLSHKELIEAKLRVIH